MIESLIERFATSPRRWLIVTAATFVLALLTVLPQTDELLAARTEHAELREQKEDAAKTAATLPDYEFRVGELEQRLAELRDVEVDADRVAELRSWLVAAAREAGCQVRRIDLAGTTSRPWTVDDSPLNPSAKSPAKSDLTPFELQTLPVSLSVTGQALEIHNLLKTLDEDARVKFASTVELRPVGRKRTELQLDLSLKYFALAPTNRDS